MGRHSSYRPKYCKDIVKYFITEKDSGRYPVVAGFATSIDVCKDTIYEWAKVYPKFSDSLRKAMGIAESLLMNKALDESWNPGFSKFLAMNNFNYLSDNQKVESNNTHNFPTGITISFIDKKES